MSTFLAVGFLSVRYRIKNAEELFDTRNPERLPDALAYPDQSQRPSIFIVTDVGTYQGANSR